MERVTDKIVADVRRAKKQPQRATALFVPQQQGSKPGERVVRLAVARTPWQAYQRR